MPQDDTDPLLTEEEACATLGVPPFLLRDFVSYEFNGLKLEPMDRKARQRVFRQSAITSFAAHLDAPWPGSGRPDIPQYIQHYLVLEAAGRCALCREEHANYDWAHIRDWSTTRCHSPHNLIRLCVACHRSYGKDSKKLNHAKELVRQRLLVDRIYVGEREIERLSRSVFRLIVVLVMAFGLGACFIVDGWIGRRVDVERLASRLASAAATSTALSVAFPTKQARIEAPYDKEARLLAEDLAAALAKAGWNVELRAVPTLSGRGLMILLPVGTLMWKDSAEGLAIEPLAMAILDEGQSRRFGAFRVYTEPSPDFRRQILIIRVLARE